LFRRSGRLSLGQDPLVYRKGDDWARGLEDVREPTVIVYLALHGGADGKGAYLLPHDATSDPEDRLRLEAVLERLDELPASKNKLLILDATALTPSVPLGLLHNDFARALADLDEQIAAVPNLVVISSSDVDQRSLPAPGSRSTLFGRHLVRGLSGEAKRRGRLDAWGLFRHVRTRVSEEANDLGLEQTPLLLPRDDGPAPAR